MAAKRPTPAANVRHAIPITAATERPPAVLTAVSRTSPIVRQSARPAKAVVTRQNVRGTVLPVVHMVSAILVRLAVRPSTSVKLSRCPRQGLSATRRAG